MATIQMRRGTAAQWTTANTVLSAGEWGAETDTLKVKIGNGSTAWNSLAYAGGGSGGSADVATVAAAIGTADYIVSVNAGTYTATATRAGLSTYTGTNFTTVLQNAINALTPSGANGSGGGTIHLTDGTYTFGNEVTIIGWEGITGTSTNPASQLVIEGEGFATKLVQNTSGQNAFVVKNCANFVLKDLRANIGASAKSFLFGDKTGSTSEMSCWKAKLDNLNITSASTTAAPIYLKNFFDLDAPKLWVYSSAYHGIVLENDSTTTNYGNSHFGFLRSRGAATTPYAGLVIQSVNTSKFMDMLTFENYESNGSYYGIYAKGASWLTFGLVDLEDNQINIMLDGDTVGQATTRYVTINSGYLLPRAGGTGIRNQINAGGHKISAFIETGAGSVVPVNDTMQFLPFNAYDLIMPGTAEIGNMVFTDPSKQDLSARGIDGTYVRRFPQAAKTTPVDADSLVLSDSADVGTQKKLSLANLKGSLDGRYVQSTQTIPFSRGGTGSGTRLSARTIGDGISASVIDWNHSGDTIGYLIHLTVDANTVNNAAALAIGTDDGLANGIFISHKNAAFGFSLNQNPGAGIGGYITGRTQGQIPFYFELNPGSGPVLLQSSTAPGFADGHTTSGSPTLTSATANFTAADIGATVLQQVAGAPTAAGVNPLNAIGVGVTITAVASPTSCTMSANAGATGTGVRFLVTGRTKPTTESLLELRNESSGVLSKLSKSGLWITAGDVAQTPLKVTGAASQSVDIFEVLINGNSTPAFLVASNGGWAAPFTGVVSNAGAVGGIPLTVLSYANGQAALVLRCAAATTPDLVQYRGTGSTALSRVNSKGVRITGVNTAPADADLATNEVGTWFDSSAGAAVLNFKGKDAGGTVCTGAIPLNGNPAITYTGQRLYGSGAPASGLGYNGDTYTDYTAEKKYTKAAGAWTVTNDTTVSKEAAIAGAWSSSGGTLSANTADGLSVQKFVPTASTGFVVTYTTTATFDGTNKMLRIPVQIDSLDGINSGLFYVEVASDAGISNRYIFQITSKDVFRSGEGEAITIPITSGNIQNTPVLTALKYLKFSATSNAVNTNLYLGQPVLIG